MSDIQIQQSPQDTISSLNWAPNSNLLVAGSWDCKAYCWEVQQNGSTAPKSMIKHDAPVLCTDFHSDGTKVFTGSCDKTVKIWSLQTGQSSQVAAHDKPVKAVQWIQPLNLLVTGSWDKKLKYWDLRTNNPVGTVDLPERLYCMDVIHPLMVVATADRHVWVFDLNKPTQPFQRKQSALKFQTRSLACFPNKTGYALGSIEGRVSISYVDEKIARSVNGDFAFKCHRVGNDMYAVNSIAFHQRHGTFATAGSDGTYVFWDKDSKHRLKASNRLGNAITAAAFNKDGNIYAYALGYDWSKGVEFWDKSKPNAIYLRGVQDAEVRPRRA